MTNPLMTEQALTEQTMTEPERKSSMDGGTNPSRPYSLTHEQQKIVHALADDAYFWRSRRRILEVTGLEPAVLDHSMAQLIHHHIVKPAFGERSIIFGLRERVDKK